MFTPEQRERLTEGLSAMRDDQLQQKEIAGKDDVIAIQIIKGLGFVNLIFDAYGLNETTFTLDDNSFNTFVERLIAVDSTEMGHDCFTFKKYDDHCPEMAEPEPEDEEDDLP